LYETYDRILHGIRSEYKENAIKILQFLAFSERPLRIAEIVDAIVVEPTHVPCFDIKSRMPDPHEISRYCSSLVVMVSKKGHSYNEDDNQHNNNKGMELQLAHFSVKEYLTSNRLPKDIAQSFEEVAAKASIATVCLAYLLHLDRDFSEFTIRKTFPLAEYSARYWISYATVAEGKDETLQSFIEKFLCYDRSSYRNCYRLYLPDNDIKGELASPLYYASFGGLVNAVKCLLYQGADVKARGGYYGTALQVASARGHEKVVELLLSYGADVNERGGRFYDTALQVASAGGYEKVVKLLLSNGADVNAKGGEDYGMALQAASARGYEKIVELLLSYGADVSPQGKFGNTALKIASRRGHEKVIKLLLSKGAI